MGAHHSVEADGTATTTTGWLGLCCASGSTAGKKANTAQSRPRNGRRQSITNEQPRSMRPLLLESRTRNQPGHYHDNTRTPAHPNKRHNPINVMDIRERISAPTDFRHVDGSNAPITTMSFSRPELRSIQVNTAYEAPQRRDPNQYLLQLSICSPKAPLSPLPDFMRNSWDKDPDNLALPGPVHVRNGAGSMHSRGNGSLVPRKPVFEKHRARPLASNTPKQQHRVPPLAPNYQISGSCETLSDFGSTLSLPLVSKPLPSRPSSRVETGAPRNAYTKSPPAGFMQRQRNNGLVYTPGKSPLSSIGHIHTTTNDGANSFASSTITAPFHQAPAIGEFLPESPCSPARSSSPASSTATCPTNSNVDGVFDDRDSDSGTLTPDSDVSVPAMPPHRKAYSRSPVVPSRDAASDLHKQCPGGSIAGLDGRPRDSTVGIAF